MRLSTRSADILRAPKRKGFGFPRKFLPSSVDPLRSPQFAGGSVSDQTVELSAEPIHIAASKGTLDIVKDLLATWKRKERQYW